MRTVLAEKVRGVPVAGNARQRMAALSSSLLCSFASDSGYGSVLRGCACLQCCLAYSGRTMSSSSSTKRHKRDGWGFKVATDEDMFRLLRNPMTKEL
jgi:hypothetical protein